MAKNKIALTVKGMTCQGCVNSVTRIVKRNDPDAQVMIDLASGRLEAETSADAQTLSQAISAAGYETRPA
jgi:copper chaperone